MASIEERVETLVRQPIEELGYRLYDVVYVKEGKEYFLRIFIENEEGISLEDCEKVNNAINELLDQADIVKDQYFLEVSSTGVEKVLRKDWHLKENIGEKIVLSLFKPINGKKEIRGELQSFDSGKIVVDDLEITRKDISLIRKYYDWGN